MAFSHGDVLSLFSCSDIAIRRFVVNFWTCPGLF